MKFLCSLPVVMFTYKFLEICIKKAPGRITVLLGLSMLANMNHRTGVIFKFKVKDKAKQFGCDKNMIYRARKFWADNGMRLKLRNGTVSGRFNVKELIPTYVMEKWELGDLTEADLNGHKMCVGMLHPILLDTLLKSRTQLGHINLLMSCCLNVEVSTGKLHEKTHAEWSDLACIHRTYVSQGFRHLNEIGAIDTVHDYDEIGHLPFTAMANTEFKLIEHAKQKNTRDPEDLIREKRLVLYEIFGINVKGLAHKIIEDVWLALKDVADEVKAKSLQSLSKMVGRELSVPIPKHKGIVSGGSTIPMREALPPALKEAISST